MTELEVELEQGAMVMNPIRVLIAVLTSAMRFCPALNAESYRVVLRAAQTFEEGQGAWKV